MYHKLGRLCEKEKKIKFGHNSLSIKVVYGVLDT